MHVADRVSQAATATSDAIYVLGSAVTGFRTFDAGFHAPTTGALGGTLEWPNVPILVETDTAWQLITATVERNGSGLVSIKSGVVRESSTGAALGLTGGAACTLSVVPSYWQANQVAFDPYTPASDADRYNQRPQCDAGSLMALGKNAHAMTNGLLAIGQDSLCAAGALAAIGKGVQVSEGLGFARGENMVCWAEDWYGVGSYTAGANVGAAIRGQVIRNGTTTNATQTPLSLVLQGGTASFTDTIVVPAGLCIVEGYISAIDMDSGDRKVWSVSFIVSTTLDLATTALFGSLTKTVVQADAGASGWDVDVTTSSGDNSFSVKVTGEAATNINWVFSGSTHYHSVLV